MCVYVYRQSWKIWMKKKTRKKIHRREPFHSLVFCLAIDRSADRKRVADEHTVGWQGRDIIETKRTASHRAGLGSAQIYATHFGVVFVCWRSYSAGDFDTLAGGYCGEAISNFSFRMNDLCFERSLNYCIHLRAHSGFCFVCLFSTPKHVGTGINDT